MKKGFIDRIFGRARAPSTDLADPPGRDDSQFKALQEAVDSGDLETATKIDSTLPEGRYLPAGVLVLRGRLAQARGDARRAIDYFDLAAKQGPPSGEAHFWCAGACMRAGLESEALDHALAAERLKPGHPDMRTLIGVVRHRQHDEAGARKAFESALEVDPANIVAHRNLALIFFQQQDWSGAERHFGQLVRAQPQSHFALSGHASCLVALGREEEAWPLFVRVLDMPGNTAGARGDYAVALFDAGRLVEARAQIDEALRLDPEQALLHVGRANCELIANGSSAAAWAEYQWRLRLNTDRFGVRTRMWAGEAGIEGRLLVYAEQGMGDVILFSRYMTPLSQRVGTFALQIPPALGRLMRASAARFGWNVGAWVESSSRVEPEQASYDREVPLLSLVHVCGFSVERSSHPYLDVETALKRQWAERLGARSHGRLRVGLVWAGNPARREDVIRSILPEQLAPLRDLSNVQFVKLQMDCKPEYRQAPFPVEALDPTTYIRDFADTAAIMHNLDLVLSIDTAAAHLSGALGIPCWVLLSKVPDWRWKMGDIDQPWYGALRSFSVDRQRDWLPLMERVAGILRLESRETLEKHRSAVD